MSGPVEQLDRPELSVIVPVYNGEAFIAKNVSDLIAYLATRPGRSELIIVNDGSTDRTPELVEQAIEAAPIHVLMLSNERNEGKGAAVARGMQAARGDHRVFLDADLAYPPEQIETLCAALSNGTEVAIACRAHRSSRLVVHSPYVSYFLIRHVIGRLLNRVVRLLLLPGVSDSQAGLKGFSAAAAGRLFSGWLPRGFSFDLALLFRSRRLGLKLAQVPVVYRYDREPGTVRLARDTLRMLRDLVQIRTRLVSDRFEQWGTVVALRRRLLLDKTARLVLSPASRGTLIAAFGLSLLALVMAQFSTQNSAVAVTGWLGTLTALLLWSWRVDLAPDSRRRTSAPAHLARTRGEIALLTSVILVGAALRFYRLGDLPPMIHGDSADCGLLGMNLLKGSVRDVFDFSPWYWTPYISFVPYALSFWLKGLSVASLRVPSALFGAAALVPMYFLVRGWFGKRAAVVATAMLASSHAAIHFSRIGLWNIQILFAEITAFALLTAGLRRRSTLLVASSGVVSGAALYSYTGGRLIAVVAVVFLLTLCIRRRREAGRALLGYCVALAVTAIPLALSYMKHPEVLRTDRTASVWVLAEVNRHHVESTLGVTSPPAIFWKQAQRTIAGFFSLGDSSAQYGTEQPLLSPVTAVLALLGLLVTLGRWRSPPYRFLLLWLGFGLFLGSIVVINPPAYTRLIVLFPVPYILAAVAIEASVPLVRKWVPLRRADVAALCVLIVAQSAAFDLLGYRDFTRRMALVSREWDALKVMERLGDKYEYYLYTGPFVLADSPIFRLFSTGTKAMSGFSEADLPNRLSRDAAFVLTPEYRRVGLAVSTRFPNAEREAVTQEGIRQLLVYRCSLANGCRKGVMQ